jgi:hypothetical protein
MAVIIRLPRMPGGAQVFFQIRLLVRQTKSQPLRENLVMAVPQRPLRIFFPQNVG